MPENVASNALRGLSNALDLTGSRSAPPGIELAIPSQGVDDLTQYVRYGSAHVFGRFSDGWLTLGVRLETTAVGFSSFNLDDWSAEVSGDFGISLGRLSRMALWVYGVSIRISVVGSLADLGATALFVRVPAAMLVNGGGLEEHIIFASDGLAANRVDTGPLETRLMNQARPSWPFQWAAGQRGVFRGQNLSTNSVEWNYSLLCRMLPMGQAPLP